MTIKEDIKNNTPTPASLFKKEIEFLGVKYTVLAHRLGISAAHLFFMINEQKNRKLLPKYRDQLNALLRTNY